MRKMVMVAALTGAMLPVGTALAAGTTAAPTTVVRYGFDGGIRPGGLVSDDTGAGRDLSTLSRNGGAVRTVAHGAGLAVTFPAVCHPANCPRAILQGSDDPRLDTGTADFSYGASVLLRPDQVSDGENVMQKGVSRSKSQWKLQVDGSAGRPSCVLVGRGSKRHYLAVSSVGIADGAWHSLACQRAGGRLTITVDGTARGSVAVPAQVSLDNDVPLRIGGKNTAVNNDQFSGAIDDVWVVR